MKNQKLTKIQLLVPELPTIEETLLTLKGKWVTTKVIIEACGFEELDRSLQIRLGRYLADHDGVAVKKGRTTREYLVL